MTTDDDGLAIGRITRLTPEEARKLHRAGTSQDTPGLGGVPEPPEGITGQWVRAEPEPAECRLCAHIPEDGPEPLLRFASKFCPIHGTGTEWRARAEAAQWATGIGEPASPVELPEGKVLRVAPGDVVVFQFPDTAVLDMDAVNQAIQDLLPDGVTALILSDAVEVTKITAGYAEGYRDGYGHADNGTDAVIPERTAEAIAADARFVPLSKRHPEHFPPAPRPDLPPEFGG